ncbi:exonuclease domain-containing protein [Corynebacterium striatum]|uniref:exonuclease domain-containing protein n=2 Tax=Corynebacterium TaxID=1716 RepID=UPI000C28BBF4|nr:exonuclease domain-containing protein [Corynebacterium striatum]ATZ06568.1 DNA polymerase III subunit epsilon [Corynebacterium striatum]MDK8825963.1 exonuclease domain-containing protein [Corynebacterium striatum]MDK8832943.1 exonuclease domain-containing protein [Corynebacterium striatum]MDK8877210.1 exonuclease domain-containing protein [Corynebacterium striatum]MDK8882047.1 exonuclease domain-containing protein [Corynebacterium striatum]
MFQIFPSTQTEQNLGHFIGFLENLLNRYTPRMPCEPVFAVIDTETTGFNKRYDRIIGLAAVRADANFNPVDSWHTLLTPDTNAVFTTRGKPPTSAFNPAVGVTRSEAS